MAYNYEYPYADMSRANVDWLLNEMKELKTTVDTLIEEFADVDAIVSTCNAYTDEQVTILRQLIASNTSSIQNLSNRLDSNINSLTNLIADTELAIMVDVNNKYVRNQQAIAQQWTDMVNYINSQLLDVKVRNFFTGELTTIQAMFDYLSRFHLVDAATYTEVTGLNTYAYYEAKNKTYEEVTVDSKNFFEVP